MDNDAVLVTTMNDVPGFRIVAVYGEVFGLICRARNAFSNFGAGLRTMEDVMKNPKNLEDTSLSMEMNVSFAISSFLVGITPLP